MPDLAVADPFSLRLDPDARAVLERLPVSFAMIGADRQFIVATHAFMADLMGVEALNAATPEAVLTGYEDALALLRHHLGVDPERGYRQALNGWHEAIEVAQRLRDTVPLGRFIVDFHPSHDEQDRVNAVVVRISEVPHEVNSAVIREFKQDGPFGEWFNRDFPLESIVNDRWFDIMGYTRADLKGRTVAQFWGDVMHPEDRKRLVTAASHRRVPVVEYRMLHSDGVYRWMRSECWSLQLSPDGTSSVQRGILYNFDNERRNRIELETALERSLDLLDAPNEGVLRVGPGGRIQWADHVAQRMVGMPRETMVGRLIHEVLPITDLEGHSLANHLMVASYAANRGTIPQARLRRSDGSTITVSISYSAEPFGQDGRAVVVFGVRDITPVWSVSAQRDLNERLKALGRLAGSIAHDFNNLLHVIQGAAELIQLDPKFTALAPGARESVRLMVHACDQAAELTSKLLPAKRADPLAPAAIDLHASIRSIAEILRFSTDDRVEVNVELQATDSVVALDLQSIEAALLNLGLNSQQAMPSGGTITITSHNRHLTASDCMASPFDLVPGLYCVVTFCDNGSGIHADDIDYVFEPFYSRRVGGSGLGLAGVHRVIVESGGAIQVASEVGAGTTFELLLPTTNGTASPSEIGGEPQGRTLTDHAMSVLLAEDDRQVAQVMAAMLELLGCRVSMVGDGVEAVQAVSREHSFDAVILDLRMARMGGDEALRRIRSVDKDLPVVVVSGQISPTTEESLRRIGVTEIAQKPVSVDCLDRVLTAIQLRREDQPRRVASRWVTPRSPGTTSRSKRDSSAS